MLTILTVAQIAALLQDSGVLIFPDDLGTILMCSAAVGNQSMAGGGGMLGF